MKKINKVISLSLIGSMLITSMPVYALEKDETVYTKLNNDGSVKSTTVVEYVSDDKNISDVTNLKNILNINGDENANINGENISFDANDVFYQGETDKELPVSLDITYKLDGEVKKIEEILGCSGKVTIDIKYKNNDSHKVLVNGKYVTMYTPFVVTTGAIISSDNNENISVNNGKVVTNGTSNVVVSLAAPGLSDSLKMDLNMEETIITMDTESFELPTIYSVVTSNLISQDDLKIFDKLDSLYSNMDALDENSNLLVEGSNKLVGGAKTYASKFKEFNIGMNQLNDGSKLLTNGYSQIDNGIKTLANGVQQMTTLASAVNTLSENISKLSYLTNQIASNSEGIATTVDSTILGLQSHIENLTRIAAATTDNATKDALIAEISGLEQQLDIDSLTSLKTNIDTLNSSLQLLNSKMTELNTQTSSLGEDMADLITGISALESGSTSFKENLQKLNDSISLLNNYSNKLNDGANDIVTGTEELNNGITKFDTEGIDKLVSLVNGNVKSMESSIKELINLGSDYDTFTMNKDGNESSTKFVLMIDGEKKEEVKETQNNSKQEKINLWQRFLNLFK